MKYKVGDRIRIKNFDWYNDNKDEDGDVPCSCNVLFLAENKKYLGTTQTIEKVYICEGRYVGNYIYKLKGIENTDWTDEMIEGLVEEENVLNKWTGLKVELELSKSVIGVSNVESLRGERFMSGFVKAIIPPDGYQFVDENGNVINTTKIVLEKKKKEYPKTYEECHEIMVQWKECDCNPNSELILCDAPIHDFCKLIVARNIYWKIAGEEMGLGKAWEPDWTDNSKIKYGIRVCRNSIQEYDSTAWEVTFTFPTPEMRDAFKENFDKDLETCKELL